MESNEAKAKSAIAPDAGAPKAGTKPVEVLGVAINVTDFERSSRFYTEICGLKVAARIPEQGPLMELALSVSGGISETIVVLAKIDAYPRKPGAETFGRIVMPVANLEAIMKRAIAAGCKVEQLKSAEGVLMPVAFVDDPDGYKIEFLDRAALAALNRPSTTQQKL